MKRMLITVLALSLVALVAMPALAEVQNIKVSGGITIRGFIRDNFGSGITSFQDSKSRDWYMSTTTLGVDADLTDNVAASILIGNERDWQAETDTTSIVALASYVTVKELLYSPLTLKAGRMPVVIADGLVIGDGYSSHSTLLAGGNYSAQTQFDTIHAILDYDPLTLIIGTIKVEDLAADAGDDADGYLVDAIYKFDDDMKTVLDVYGVNVHYNSDDTSKGLDAYALAGVVTLEPVERLDAKLGLAYQMGDYTADRDLKAMAFDLGLGYAIDTDYSPKVGVKYVYRSGQDNSVTTGDFKGWQALFENQINGAILDPNTNISAIDLNASIVPLDRLTLALDLWWFNLNKQQVATASTTDKKEAGQELDLAAKYAYTEDVSMGLSLAWFFPGNYYADGYDKTAMQAMAELGVKF